MYVGTCNEASCSSDLVSKYHVDAFFWRDQTVFDETILPLAGQNAYQLWRPATSISSVRNRQTGQTYTPDVDYQLLNGEIVIPQGSAISRTPSDWVTTADPTNPPLWQPVTKAGGQLRISSEYQVRHIAVTYASSQFSVEPLPGQGMVYLNRKLAAGQGISILFAGDSITEGDDSTGVLKLAPGQPGYAALATAYLAQKYPGKITAKNVSAPGEGTTYFTAHPELFEGKPDVLVLGLGMNDAPAPLTGQQHEANMRAIIAKQRAANPLCEVVIVTPWVANPDWGPSNNDLLNEYRAAAHQIARTLSDVYVADTHETALAILQRKPYQDVTANGVNHPNDWMYVVFAQLLLKTMLGL